MKQRGVLGRRTVKVFGAGRLPALQYGAEIHGTAWLIQSSVLSGVRPLSTLKPACSGRPLRILSRAEGDPG